MDLTNLSPLAIGFLTHALICAAWWYVAANRRDVLIYFWLAAVHSVSLLAHSAMVYFSVVQASPELWRMLSPLQMSLGAAEAALYVVLAIRLAHQP